MQVLPEFTWECEAHLQDCGSHSRLQFIPIRHRAAVRAARHGEHEREHHVARRSQGVGGARHLERAATALRPGVGQLPGTATPVDIHQAPSGRQVRRLVDRNECHREQAV